MTAADSLLSALRSIYPGDTAMVAAANVAVQVAACVAAAWVVSRLVGRFAGAAARHGVWLGALACVAAVILVTVALPGSAVALIRLPMREAGIAVDAVAPATVADDTSAA